MDQGDSSTFVTYAVFDVANADPVLGYERSTYSETGAQTEDQQRDVRYATPDGQNPNAPGYLYGGLSRGHFRFLGKVTPPAHSLDLVASMRLPDTSGDKSEVVAKLIFEYR